MLVRDCLNCLQKKLLAGALLLLLTASCARVRPEGDYQRTAQMVAERTGAESFTPLEQDAVDQRVDELLADGVSVDEAVRIGLLNSPHFQSLFQKIGSSRADVVQSKLLSNPSLSVSLRFPEGGGRSNLTMGFGQQLVDLWQIPVRRRVAEAELDQIILDVVREAVALAAEIKSQCYKVLALKEAERITTKHMALVERSMNLAKKRLDAGEISKLDVNLVSVNRLQAQSALINLRRDRREAEIALAKTLGLNRRHLTWQLRDKLPEQASSLPDERTLLDTALKQRLDAKASVAQIRQADQELRKQYLSIFPDVTVGAELERMERRALPGRKILADTARASVANGQLTAPDIQSRAQRDFERRQIIDSILGPTISLTLPIWDQNQAQIAKAKYKVVQLRTEFEGLLDQIAEEVSQAMYAYDAGRDLLQFYVGQGLPRATENVDDATQAYLAGELNVIALSDAQENLIEQQRAYINTQQELALARVELERAVGGRLPVATSTSQPAMEQPKKEEVNQNE